MTVNFFVPRTSDAAHAERLYQDLATGPIISYPLLNPNARVYCLTFHHDGKEFQATVGKTIPGWPEPVGIVLAIIESTSLVYVRTAPEGENIVHTIFAGHPQDCRNRQWFADFSAPNT